MAPRETIPSLRRLATLALAAGSLFTLFTLGACGADADPGSRVTGLRVLAVRADKPYARPGDTVTLQTLWYDGLDPDGTQRARTSAWATCVNPSSSSVVACFAKIAEDAAATGRPPEFGINLSGVPDTFTVSVPSDTIARLPEPARVYAEVGVVFIVCPGTLKLPDPQAGFVPGTFPIQCIDEAGRSLGLDEFEAGLKRVFVRTKDTNANPVIDSITWDGEAWPASDTKSVSACETDGNRYDRCDASLAHQVAVNVTPDSFESGTDEFGASFTEQLIAQYYATEGIFEYDVKVAKAPLTGWVARSKARGSTIRMWLVARDSRGGVSWEERKVTVP